MRHLLTSLALLGLFAFPTLAFAQDLALKRVMLSSGGMGYFEYEATIEDPKVFTRPWKMSMPLYRRVERNAELAEFKCIEFAEDALYGYLRKPGTK